MSSFSHTFVSELKLWVTKRRSPSKKSALFPPFFVSRRSP